MWLSSGQTDTNPSGVCNVLAVPWMGSIPSQAMPKRGTSLVCQCNEVRGWVTETWARPSDLTCHRTEQKHFGFKTPSVGSHYSTNHEGYYSAMPWRRPLVYFPLVKRFRKLEQLHWTQRNSLSIPPLEEQLVCPTSASLTPWTPPSTEPCLILSVPSTCCVTPIKLY